MTTDDRKFYLAYADALSQPGDFSSNIAIFFGEGADINVVHPFNQLKGVDKYLKDFLFFLLASLHVL